MFSHPSGINKFRNKQAFMIKKKKNENGASVIPVNKN